MSLGFIEKRKVDDYIQLLALNKIKRFYPSAISNNLGIPTSVVFNYLLERSGTGKELNLVWELQCPNYDCLKTIEIVTIKQKQREIECPRCGYEFELHDIDFIPAFQINTEFKDFLISETLKKKVSKKPVLL